MPVKADPFKSLPEKIAERLAPVRKNETVGKEHAVYAADLIDLAGGIVVPAGRLGVAARMIVRHDEGKRLHGRKQFAQLF